MAPGTPKSGPPRSHPPSRSGTGMSAASSHRDRQPGIAWTPQLGGAQHRRSNTGVGPSQQQPRLPQASRRNIGQYEKFIDNEECFGGEFRDIYLFEIWSSPTRDECDLQATRFQSEGEALGHLRGETSTGAPGAGGSGSGSKFREKSALSSSYRQTRIVFLPGQVNSARGFLPLGISMAGYQQLAALMGVTPLFLECICFQETIECLMTGVRGSQGYVLQTQDNHGARRSLAVMPDPDVPYRTNILAAGFDDRDITGLELELKTMDLTTWSMHTLSMIVLWKAIQLGMERRQFFTSRQTELQRTLGVDDTTVLSRNPLTAFELPTENTVTSQQLGNLSLYLTALAEEWSWLHREIVAQIRALEFIQRFILSSRGEDPSCDSGSSRDPLPSTSRGIATLGSGSGSDKGPAWGQNRRPRTTGITEVRPGSTPSTPWGDQPGNNATGTSYDTADDLVLDRARMLTSLLYGSSDYCTSFERGEETFRQTIYSLIAQRDSGYMQQLADTTAKDSGAMVVVSNVTAVFLPATFVATFFSTTFFDFQAGYDDVDKKIVSGWVWIYFVLSVSLTAVIFTWWKVRIRKRKENLHGLKITRRSTTQESHGLGVLNPLDGSRGTRLRSLNLPWRRVSWNGGPKAYDDYGLRQLNGQGR